MSTDPHLLDVPPWLASIGAASEMGQSIQEFDWASTSVGSPHGWSAGLKLALGICLTSRFPILVTWGPDLIEFYNDAYRPILGSQKHPRALGAPVQKVWPEIWDVVGPLFAGVMSTGEPTWSEHQLLLLERNGYVEESYFTFSFSPLFDVDGSISGVLDIVTETTEYVVTRRRLATLSTLGGSLVEADQVTDVCLRAASALKSSTSDIRGVDIFLDLGDDIVRVASSRRDESNIDHDDIVRVARTGSSLTVGGHDDLSMPAEQFAIPIGGAKSGVGGVVVARLHDQRPFDQPYIDFVQLVADAIGAALDNAYRRTVELGQYRQISDTLQAAMLKPASDNPTFAARYLPATGNLAVGGDWYDVIDLGAHRRGLVVGDCVGHGLEAATVMAQLRSAARAMLLEGRHPAATLDGLDLFAASLEGAYCATVVCAVFDRQDGVITYSRAGHPPPLIVNASGTTWLDQAGGPPLAVANRQVRKNATLQLSGNDVIILYSDGLIERRTETLDAGFDRLAGAATELFGSAVQPFADGLLKRLLPAHASDDVVLVVKQLTTSSSGSSNSA